MTAKELTKRRQKGFPIGLDFKDPFYFLQREMNRLLEDFWLRPWESTEIGNGSFMPAVNVRENENEVHISAELPGLDKGDIEVTIREDRVILRGEKKQEEKEEKEGYLYHESAYGRFQRVIELPAEIEESKANAQFLNGVLNITLPKKPDSKKTQKIQIQSG